MIAWVAEHTPGPDVVAAVEGTLSYGVGLARALTDAGILVVESEQPQKADRRGRGKSDPIDAHPAPIGVLRRDGRRVHSANGSTSMRSPPP